MLWRFEHGEQQISRGIQDRSCKTVSSVKAGKRHLQRIRGCEIDDVGMDMQVRRPHTEIVGGQRHRGCRRGIHRHHHALKGGTQQQNHNQHHERICENIQERVFDPVPRFQIGQRAINDD